MYSFELSTDLNKAVKFNGKCTSLCENYSRLCHTMSKYILLWWYESNQICTDCNHENNDVASIVFEDSEISCRILEDLERRIVQTCLMKCINNKLNQRIQGYAIGPVRSNAPVELQFYMYEQFDICLFEHSAIEMLFGPHGQIYNKQAGQVYALFLWNMPGSMENHASA